MVASSGALRPTQRCRTVQRSYRWSHHRPSQRPPSEHHPFFDVPSYAEKFVNRVSKSGYIPLHSRTRRIGNVTFDETDASRNRPCSIETAIADGGEAFGDGRPYGGGDRMRSDIIVATASAGLRDLGSAIR
jgi:hypothetical protein